MDIRVKKAVKEIVDMCFEYNYDNFHTFFDFSGHVGKFSGYVYTTGWSNSGDPTYLPEVYLDGPLEDTLIRLDCMKEKLQDLYNQRQQHLEYKKQKDIIKQEILDRILSSGATREELNMLGVRV